MNTQKRWQDWVKGIAGLWLFLSPWVLGVTGDSASSWNGWIVGLLIIIGSVVALRAPHGLGSQWFVGIVDCGWFFHQPLSLSRPKWSGHASSSASLPRSFLCGL